MKNINLVLATGNSGKVKEIKEILSDLPVSLVAKPDGLEVEETGKSFKENARLKALSVAVEASAWALADDSGLEVEALNGAPGIFSGRYADNDEERVKRLLNELEPFMNRKAKFISALCIAKENEVLLEVEGFCEGIITTSPRGENGFGYDPIFQVAGQNLTFAEMSIAQKRKLGHRGHSLKLLKPALRKILDRY